MELHRDNNGVITSHLSIENHGHEYAIELAYDGSGGAGAPRFQTEQHYGAAWLAI